MIQEAVFHTNTLDYRYPVARNQLAVKIRVGTGQISETAVVYWNRTEPLNRKQQKMICVARDERFDYFETVITFPKIARYQKYFFVLKDKEGKQWFYSQIGVTQDRPEEYFFEFLYVNPNDCFQAPEWAKGVVYYQIFPERFYNGNPQNDPKGCVPWGTQPTRENYMGGDLEGIIQKIPYIKALGIECLYINPIFKADFNHKYATADYFEIDPIFGTNNDLKRLVELCHDNQIRVILDGVFNHTGIHFAPFEDAVEKGEKSIYKDWFFFEQFPVEISHHNYECVGAYKYMPKLNTSNREVREFIISVMDFWVCEYGIDGWRLDVADEVDGTVWNEARLRLKEKYPSLLLLGETWGDGGELLSGHQMDCVMNYPFRDTVRDFFAKGKISLTEFDHRINRMLGNNRTPTNHIQYNLLDSHDTERFLRDCEEDKRKFKLAVAFQMLFIGAPAIYYGDEVGMTGENDPDCRRCMIWDEQADKELWEWYQSLITIRRQSKAIRQGDFYTIVCDEQKNVYGFLRKCEAENLIVLINCSEGMETITCPTSEACGMRSDIGGGTCYRVKPIEQEHFYNEDIMGYRGTITVEMEPYSVKVIKSKEER